MYDRQMTTEKQGYKVDNKMLMSCHGNMDRNKPQEVNKGNDGN